MTVHPLDAEYRFGVQLAGRAGDVNRSGHSARGLPAALLHVTEPLLEERQDVPVVERVENHPSFPAGPNDARVSQQAQLM